MYDPTLSVCVIVKNEAPRMRAYFDTVLLHADEVVVIDTGSTDGTTDIIKEYRDTYPEKIIFDTYHHPGVFHYAAAKNQSIRRATKDYIFILDADEVPEADFFPKLKIFLREKKPEIATVVRTDHLLPHFRELQLRIIKNGAGIYSEADDVSRIHEVLIHNGTVLHFSGVIIHSQGDNHWVIRPERILPLLALDVAWTKKEKSFWGHLLRGLWMFQYKFRKVYFRQEVRKDGAIGFKFAFMKGLYDFLVQLFVGLKPNASHSRPHEDADYDKRASR